MSLDALLENRFGYREFRAGQREVVDHVLQGGDALVVMPTGAGKSLCFQVPALALGGTTIVVSPLIALMKDQVDTLVAKDVRATFLNSSISRDEYQQRSDAVQRGEIELLYVAPERFTPAFCRWLQSVRIGLFAIDEAHCLSQWGHDFRPDYLRLGKVRETLGKPTTIALTATATPEVQRDIVETLGIGQGRTFIRGFDRENLVLEVVHVDGKKHKDTLLADLVQPGPSLVYCATRKNVERAVVALHDAGVRAGMYHAGLSPDERSRVQEDFMAGRVPVVAATNAFGMGIDKRDIRCIVHYDMPGTVEAYYQEIGRAGRDGRTSRAVLLHNGVDRRIHEFFIDNAHPPADWVHRLYDWLKRQGSNPVFARVEEMVSALPAEAGDRAATSCIYILVREGMVRRISPADRSAWIEVKGRPDTLPQGVRGKVWGMVAERGLGTGEALQFQPDGWCRLLGIERDQLGGALRGLEDRGLLSYRAPERSGGVELLRPTERLTLDEARMRKRRGREYTKLDRMEAYVAAPCRRRYVIEYFGEKAPYEACGTCDACRTVQPLSDGPRTPTPDEEQVILKTLSCVARMERHHGRAGFSLDLVAKTLVGSTEKKVRTWGFDRLSTWGLLAPKGGPTWTSGEVIDLITALADAGCLEATYNTRKVGDRERTFKEVCITELGWSVLRREDNEIELVFPHASKLTRRRGPIPASAKGVPGDLMALLRDVRKQIADRRNVPAYVVAPNKTLEDMARLRPASERALLSVHGMGPTRCSLYGRAFLDAIATYKAPA